MNFCPNCGKRIVDGDNEVPILCSCMEAGFCVKCGNKMNQGGKKKKRECETCSNAYTFIINCECHVDNITVKCTKCGAEPIPFTKDEFTKHENHIYYKHKEIASQAQSLRQKKVLLRRLVKNMNGKHCQCTANFECSSCYVSW